MVRLTAIIPLLTVALVAQNTPPPQPNIFFAAGGAYTRGASPVVTGWLSYGQRVSQSNTYSFTTIELTGKNSSTRTGIAYLLGARGKVSLYGIADAGITNGAVNGQATNTLGSFSGGEAATFAINNKYSVILVIRAVKTASTALQPTFELGIGRTF